MTLAGVIVIWFLASMFTALGAMIFADEFGGVAFGILRWASNSAIAAACGSILLMIYQAAMLGVGK